MTALRKLTKDQIWTLEHVAKRGEVFASGARLAHYRALAKRGLLAKDIKTLGGSPRWAFTLTEAGRAIVQQGGTS